MRRGTPRHTQGSGAHNATEGTSMPAIVLVGAQWGDEGKGKATDLMGSDVDYVVGTLLAVAASLIANVRWGSPWKGWKEPTHLFVMIIGLPSMGKSPAMDAVLEGYLYCYRPDGQYAWIRESVERQES